MDIKLKFFVSFSSSFAILYHHCITPKSWWKRKHKCITWIFWNAASFSFKYKNTPTNHSPQLIVFATNHLEGQRHDGYNWVQTCYSVSKQSPSRRFSTSGPRLLHLPHQTTTTTMVLGENQRAVSKTLISNPRRTQESGMACFRNAFQQWIEMRTSFFS